METLATIWSARAPRALRKEREGERRNEVLIHVGFGRSRPHEVRIVVLACNFMLFNCPSRSRLCMCLLSSFLVFEAWDLEKCLIF